MIIRHGYVYVLSNSSMLGIYKIGMTKRSPKKRAAELSTTGVLAPFKVEYSKLMDDCQAAEKLAHDNFGRQRINTNHEFFQADLAAVIRMVKFDPFVTFRLDNELILTRLLLSIDSEIQGSR
jgi:hypothetical protein